MTRGRAVIVAAVVIVGAVLGWAVMRTAFRANAQTPPAPPTSEKVTLRFFRNPEVIPAFAAHDLDGRVVSPAEWRGKVTLVNFWATWCGPCRLEIPDLIALQQKYHDQLQIIGISEDEDAGMVKQFRTEHKITYPVVMTTPEFERMFPGINALPSSKRARSWDSRRTFRSNRWTVCRQRISRTMRRRRPSPASTLPR